MYRGGKARQSVSKIYKKLLSHLKKYLYPFDTKIKKFCLNTYSNRKGQKVKDADYQSELPSGTQARVAPNRKWFGE